MKMLRVVLAAALFVLFSVPAFGQQFNNIAWTDLNNNAASEPITFLQFNGSAYFNFTQTAISPNLNGTNCGTVTFTLDQNIAGADTAAVVDILSCPQVNSASGDCDVIDTLNTDEEDVIVRKKPGVFIAQSTTGPLSGTARLSAFCWEGVARDDSGVGGGHGDGLNCAAGNYPLGVDGDGNVQSCTADANTLGPDGDKGDITVGFSGTTLDIDTGAVNFAEIDPADVAEQAEAEAGLLNDVLMTPLRVAQAIAALAHDYSPANVLNWLVAPTTYGEGLDELSSRTVALESTTHVGFWNGWVDDQTVAAGNCAEVTRVAGSPAFSTCAASNTWWGLPPGGTVQRLEIRVHNPQTSTESCDLELFRCDSDSNGSSNCATTGMKVNYGATGTRNRGETGISAQAPFALAAGEMVQLTLQTDAEDDCPAGTGCTLCDDLEFHYLITYTVATP